MAIDGVTAGAAAYTAPAAATSKAAPKEVKAATTPAADSVTLSPLAGTLRGTSLDLFNTLEADDRKALDSLVTNGIMSAEDVHAALKDRVKQARNAAFWQSSAQFFQENPRFAEQPGDIRADELQQSVGAHLDRRKQLLGQLEALEKAGKAGSDDYAATIRTLIGQAEPSAEESATAIDDSTRRRGDRMDHHPGRRIVSPFGRSLVDPRFTQTTIEKAAGEKLTASGFASASFDRAVRSMAEADVATHVRQQADRIANTMNGIPNPPERAPEDPEFDISQIAARIG
ncbi:MAG TPA: hypothetical protein VD995_04260 [Azospirillum sp.]|nr:hypothetical protein [Azospirillum sp.]